MSGEEILRSRYPHRIPATETTRLQLSLELRKFYRARTITELAARVLLNEALRAPHESTRSAKCGRRNPERAGRKLIV